MDNNMKKITLALFISLFSFAFSYAQQHITNCYTIKFIMTHDVDHDQAAWRQVANLVKALVDYHNTTVQEESSVASFNNGLDTTAQTMEALGNLAKEKESFHVKMNVFNKEEPALDQNWPGEDELIEITIIFKVIEPITSDNKNIINTLMVNFSHVCSSDVHSAIEQFGDTTQTIMTHLSGDASIYISMFENSKSSQ
jgi:hypothetical protein